MTVCEEHSKVEQEIKDMKSNGEKQWTEIGKRATTNSITWAVGIFIILSLAVVGFLWRGQVSLADKIERVQETSDSKREEILHKIDRMGDVVIEIRTKIDLQMKTESERYNKAGKRHEELMKKEGN